MSARLTEMEFAELLTIRGDARISRFRPVSSPERPKKVARAGLAASEPAKGLISVSPCRLIVWHGKVFALPRMTQADKWYKRPEVERWRQFANSLIAEVRKAGELGDCQRLSAKVYFELPKSYSKKKRIELTGGPHRVKPDADNILKGIADACFQRDQGVWDMRCQKFWDDGHGPRLELYVCCCEKGNCR